MYAIQLAGCTPVPLAHYLKALGVLRLLGEQHPDQPVCGAWRTDRFVLEADDLDTNALVRFFLRDFQPTPILAPWNAGSGFYFRERKSDQKDPATGKKLKTGVRDEPTAATNIVTAVLASGAARLANYRRSLTHARHLLDSLKRVEAPKDEEKAELVLRLRNTVPEEELDWFDAALVITGDGLKMPPLLGTAGNGGNMDFTSNFMQRLADVFDFATGEPTTLSESWLRGALFGDTTAKVPDSAFGQFSPGGGGGVNAGPGFGGGGLVNPWDFILMLEGALLFAVASVKRLGAASDGALASPFTVRKAGVGYASAALSDEDDPRGETWMPLWDQAISLDELRALLSEGRAQVGRRAARTGVDLMRAVVSLGVDRGITGFQRYGFHKRNGDLHFAVPLERVPVRRNARVDLLAQPEIENFLDRFRSKAGPSGTNAPGGATRALRAVEEGILALCRSGVEANVQRVLIALGGAERAMARSLRWTRETNVLRPLANLSWQWLVYAYDHTSEFRLAAALAATAGRYGADWLPFRAHLEPVACGLGTSPNGKAWYAWMDNASPDVIWHEGDIVDVLNHAFTRRLIRAQQAGLDTLPDGRAGLDAWPNGSRVFVPLGDVAAFIAGSRSFDFSRFADLLWGLCLVDFSLPFDVPWPQRADAQAERPPAFYALLRLAFAGRLDVGERIPFQTAIHARAASANVGADSVRASEMAVRRLRASSVPPAVERAPLDPRAARRTAAALLFPMTPDQLASLRRTVTRPRVEDSNTNRRYQPTTHAN